MAVEIHHIHKKYHFVREYDSVVEKTYQKLSTKVPDSTPPLL